MLLDLKVLNGVITPEFNYNIFEYTVYVQDVNNLEFDLRVDKDLPVTIYGNDELTDGENHVLIEICDEKVTTYTLTVYKNNEKESLSETIETSTVEVDTTNQLLEDILTPGIITICFVIIVIIYSIIFHKKQ